jgi:glyoxylase-like metal-dependent hydrolase (beta-lactamase superfamily II)
VRAIALATTLVCVFGAPAAGETAAPFEQVYCARYASLDGYPADALLAGAPRDETVDAPFVLCAARRGDEAIVLDSGYVDQEVAARWGVSDWRDPAELLAGVGIAAARVTHVTVGHLHWDHGGGTSLFPEARFVVQQRELEFAAGRLPHNSAARVGFEAGDVVEMVRLNWEGRVTLVDGDVEGFLPGVDLYLTAGHTIGTMTTCLATVKGRVCYTSDAVYVQRNIDEDIPLGLALDPYETVESYKKIRRILRGGILIPGHEPAHFDDPERLGFRRVSDRVVAIVE